MKPEDMMDVISQIDDAHIEEFAQVRPSRFHIPWGMVATAAALCLVIASALFLHSTGLLSGETNPTDPPQPSVSTAVPTTLPTTLPTETTEPDTPFGSIPAVDDSQAGAAEPVFPNYEASASWTDDQGRSYDVSIRLPGLRPDNDGAKVINERIRSSMEAKLDGLRSAYLESGYTSTEAIDYESWQSGDILAVKITVTQGTFGALEYEYYLNTATGTALSDAGLTGLSHLEWLYRCCSMLKAHIGEDHRDGCGLFVGISMDKDGQLWLEHTCLAMDAVPQQILFDPNAGTLTEAEDMYSWFFHIQTDGAFATQWSNHLADVFWPDPAVFIQMLARQDDDAVSHVANLIWHEMPPQELSDYLAQVESIRDLADDPRVAETAQTMLQMLQSAD